MPSPRSIRHLSAGSSLVEVTIAMTLVTFSFGALFSVYSSAFPLLRSQQDTIAATLCLQERLDEIRFQSWPNLTSATGLQQNVFGSAPRSFAGLSGLVEDITVSAYPAIAGSTPLHVQRQANGVAAVISQPSSTLATAPMVRVDVRETWQRGRRTHFRETSAVIAYGGSPK